MVKSSRYFFIGGVVSLSLYFLLLGFVVYYFYEEHLKPKSYSYHKKDFLEITIAERKEEKKPKKIQSHEKKETIKQEPPKKEPVKKEEPKDSRDKVERRSLKSLFSTVKAKDYKKVMEEKRVSHKARASRLKKEINKNSLAKKNKVLKMIKGLKLSKNSASVSSKKGEYNEYIGKVQEIIDLKWQQTPQTLPGNKAYVLIKIDKYGRFSYKIEKLSYNNAFNSKLREFLESLKYTRFPPYRKGKYIEIRIEFKDE